ncbi:response regulator [Granulosicoccus sp.]|nr:response regulator [Granulosicoccus sp.]
MSVDLVVVDDDSLTLEIVAWNLRKTSICHELFLNPEQAMQFLSTTTPEILIVDFYMPNTNGVEFLEALYKKKELDACRVYLCSAIPPQEKHLEKLRNLGATVLSKDQLFDKAGLLKIIDHLQEATVEGIADSEQG